MKFLNDRNFIELVKIPQGWRGMVSAAKTE